MASSLIGTTYGEVVLWINLIFILSFSVPLIAFHFHKDDIYNYAFFSQFAIAVLTVVKVYFMGGMLNVGTPVFVGFIAPVYALTLPDKKRAVFIFLLFVIGMISATILNPHNPDDLVFAGYILGFLISAGVIFLTLYYFTTQLQKSKRAERERVKKLDDLKTKFYTHITHEFRTPLGIISGMADQMKKDPDKWLSEGHTIIKQHSENLVNLTNRLLDLSKLEANAMPVNAIQSDIALYFKYLVDSFHSFAESKNIRLLFNSEPSEIVMDFDPDKIKDIVSNLISNALKFTTQGGRVIINLKLESKGQMERLSIEIEDDGIGIPEKQLGLVFNKYFQAKNQLDLFREGSGIGLALVSELVKLLGGTIEVKSMINKGSKFTVRLPKTNNAQVIEIPMSLKPDKIYYSEEKPIKESDGFRNKESKNRLKILVIEDNADVRRYLKALLVPNFEFHQAENGLTGLNRAHELIPDLVISDVMMPEMDGYTLCRKLKSDLRTSHIPVILLTARADSDSKMTGLEMGADAYLFKPFDPEELFIRIQKLTENRKRLQEYYSQLAAGIISDKNQTELHPKREGDFINKVRNILLQNLSDESFGIDELCKNMAMSRSQLYRKFNALTDTTVHHYIMSLKLDEAKKLICNTDLNLTEIAYDTGFKSLSHFSRAFKDRFGYNPSKFKDRAELPHLQV